MRLPAKNPSAKFTAKQLTSLRREMSKITTVDPGKPTYKKLAAFLDNLPKPLLKQLATARIKFVSAMANNRLKRKGNPATPNRARFLSIVNDLQKLDADELFLFSTKHQRGRGAAGLGMSGPGSRVLVNDLANVAANLGAAKTTTGDTKKMYQRIAHDILMDATKSEYQTRKGNPTMARKKTRTAKQRAATKKMIAANKARRRKKTKTARRKTRGRKTARRKTRRNPQVARPGLKKSHLWIVFKCKGVAVSFVYMSAAGPAWTMDKAQAGLFRTKAAAHKLAKALQKKRGLATWQVGTASSDTPRAKIVAACKAGATYTGKV